MAIDQIRSSIVIEADPSEVFEYFTKTGAMVLWMGQSAQLEPLPGGKFVVDVNGAAVRGRFLELDPPKRLVFTWGFLGSSELPPGSSTVEVTLSRHNGGTLVEIVHSGLTQSESSRHAAGWRHFLGRLDRAVEEQRVAKRKGQ